jgi:CheY-like chemotaxis protein
MDKRLLVMVVDDSEDARAAMRELLRDEGYDVAVAEDGQAALELLATMERLPNVIVTDYQMPRMDGVALAEALNRNPLYTRVPLLLVTGAPPAGSSLTMIRKPVDVLQFLASIANACAGVSPTLRPSGS